MVYIRVSHCKIMILLSYFSPSPSSGESPENLSRSTSALNASLQSSGRFPSRPPRARHGEPSLAEVANKEKLLPPNFISADGFGITEAARRYSAPLIVGEAYPPFKHGQR